MIFSNPTTWIAMPTDADWGRFYKFNSTGDAGIIMPYRSYYFRDFFAGQWNDISLGFIHCTMGNGGGDTANVVAERLLEDAPVNLFHFGLTVSSNGVVPAVTIPQFVGIRGIIGGVTQIMTSPLQLAQLLPVARVNGIDYESGTNLQMPLSQGVTGTPFSIFGIRLIKNSQNNVVYLNYDADTNIALPDEESNITTMVDFLNGISGDINTPFASFNFPNLTNLKTFYIYWPYLMNRLKLQCVGVIKNS